MTRTRFEANGEKLAFGQFGRDWRFIILDGSRNGHLNAVGPYYRTKMELLADMNSYARDYGFPQ